MIISIDPNDPRPIYIQIVDEVRRGIVLGALPADSALPSVRQLAGELKVNPNTVQQAYREIERLGLAYVKRGQGTFVNAAAGDTAEQELLDLAQSLARRTLTEAYRTGINRDQLIKALMEQEDEQ